MLEKSRTCCYSILMPRPVPEMLEGRDEFYVRCMNAASMQSEFPDSQARGLVCVKIYKKNKKRAPIGMGQGSTRPRVDGVNPPPSGASNDGGSITYNSVMDTSFPQNSVLGRAIAASDGGNMPGRSRRIKAAHIHTISLVPRGANQLPVIYKAEGDEPNERHFSTLIKDEMEQGLLTAVVYAPNKRDSQGDIADAKTIQKMAHDFWKNGGNIDMVHDGKPLSKDQVFVAENFIIQKGDARFAAMKDYSGKPVDVTSGWAVVLKVEDENLRKMYREGKWNGVSMAGTADMEIEKHSEDGLLLRLLKKLGLADDTDTPDNGDLDMDKAELATILAENNKLIIGQVSKMIATGGHSAELLKAAGVKDTDDPETIDLRVQLHKATSGQGGTATAPAKNTVAKPVFKGDIAKATEEQIAAFEIEVQSYEILKAVDMGDPVAVRKAHKAISELTSAEDGVEDDDDAIGIEKTDTAEVKSLKMELHKSKQRSNQPADAPGRKPADNKISKADNQAHIDGLRIAAFAAGKSQDEINKIQ